MSLWPLGAVADGIVWVGKFSGCWRLLLCAISVLVGIALPTHQALAADRLYQKQTAAEICVVEDPAREHKLCNKHYAAKTLHNHGKTLAKDLAKEALAAATLDTQTQKTLVYKPHDWRGAAVHALGEHRELVTSSSMSRVRMLRFSITIDAWM